MKVITQFQEPFLQPVNEPLLEDRGISLWIRREDLIHQEISGNKWWKLSLNLQHIIGLDPVPTLLTFGGAYSNHLYATAAACSELGIECIGIVRGEIQQPLNPTLAFATEKGMKLVPVTRSAYRDKELLIQQFEKDFSGLYVLPEGGTNELAVRSCIQMVNGRMQKMDIICVPVGTGGTMAGIVAGMESNGSVLGFSALKGNFLTEEVDQWLQKVFPDESFTNWTITSDYHHGGYGKITDELIGFIEQFYIRHGILLDPVYTGKMMFGIYDMIRRDMIPAGSSICAIHTGGLQGWNGVRERYGIDPISF